MYCNVEVNGDLRRGDSRMTDEVELGRCGGVCLFRKAILVELGFV